MTATYCITVKKSQVKNTKGLLNLSQPEMVNGFIGIAREYGGWLNLAPDSVLKMEYAPDHKE